MLSLYFQRKQTPNQLTFHLQRKKTLKPLKLQRKHIEGLAQEGCNSTFFAKITFLHFSMYNHIIHVL